MHATLKIFRQQRTIRDLEEHLFNRIGEEIEQRANQKFNIASARTHALITWLAERLQKNNSAT